MCLLYGIHPLISFQIRRTHTQYDTFRGNHPDYSQIRSLNLFLDGRSGGGGSGPLSCRYPQSPSGTRTVCPRALATTISSILPWCSLAKRLVVNPPSKPFMSDSCPLPKSSWRSLVAIACPLALRSRAFLLSLIRQPWRRCGRSFKKISWHASLSTPQEACGIVSVSIGS